MSDQLQSSKTKTVIVTGGSKGIGYGISTAFLEQGADVVIAARNPPPQLPSAGGKSALFFAADIRNAEASQRLIDYAVEETGCLDHGDFQDENPKHTLIKSTTYWCVRC